ncbi:MAG: hypothetical protein J5U19_12135 [Candidatus Methanoperedens sp.]|nr:hypothetical protein [Candidatus Methanoperedens sp.]
MKLSKHFKDRVPTKDAVGVAKLKEAGAIIIGKTNMHKLGMGTTGLDSYYFGPVHNPWNSAACCGVVGFKGTYGLINPKGILEGKEAPDEMILWLNHPGITARSVEDIAIVLDILIERNEQIKKVDFVSGHE